MRFDIKRISYAKYDDFIEKVVALLPNITAETFDKSFEDMTEVVTVNGEQFEVDLDVDDIDRTIDDVLSGEYDNPMQTIDIRLSKKLFSQLSLEAKIPEYVLYEKEVWAYLNCFILFSAVKKRHFRNDGDFNNEDKVKRVLFSDCSTIDRSGFRWLWALAEASYDNDRLFSLTETAHRFVDPVKALYERALGTNKVLFKAFIRSIQLLDYDPRIRSNKYRSVLLTHIRNLAAMKIYESYDSVEELARVFSEDIKAFIGDQPNDSEEPNSSFEEGDVPNEED